jgi:hypothetical protein
MLASPSNPTGTVVPLDGLRAIIAETEARAGFALVDEIYQGLTYDGPHLPTALGFSDRVFVVNSFSKYFCMTGWRLGWLVAPTEYVREMERFAQNAFICVSAPAQHAALAAFSPATIAILGSAGEFQRRRDFPCRRCAAGVQRAVDAGRSIHVTRAASASPRIARRLRGGCSKRPASRSRRGSTSASIGRARTCVSPTRVPSSTSRKASSGSGVCSVGPPEIKNPAAAGFNA